ncbi:flippase [Halomonas alkalisoli]|uniref:flippase n=1 Tax=Halomonas alkalisoli TaxID=2907158 RepID=UPI001F28364F|nr:flippase [Halomonas alkalisoli]MCE9681655.1 flippase [Halomonas alkalisoli]
MLKAIECKVKELISHQGFRRYAANTSWMMAEQMLRIIAGLLVGIWVARYLGPEQFGLFSYVIAFTAIFGGMAKLGLDGIMVRELVNKPEMRDTYLGTAFWLKFCGAFMVMALIALVVPFTSNDTTTNLFIFIISAGLVFQSFEVVEFYFQSQVLAKVVSICKVIQLTLSSLIKLLLVVAQADLFWFVLVTVVDAMSLATSYYIASQLRMSISFYKCFDTRVAKSLLKASWPLIFSSLVVMIYMRTDQIMIKEMLGDYEVGVYSAAAKLSEAFYFIPGLLGASLFPAILSARKDCLERYENKLVALLRFVYVISLMILLPLLFFSQEIIHVLFGGDYKESSSILSIHVMGMIFAFSGIVASRWFIAEGLQILTLRRTAAGAVVNVILNLLLIPKWGVYGAAFATVTSQLLASYVFNALTPKGRIIFRLQTKAFLFLR